MAICKLANDITRASSCGYQLAEIVNVYMANFDDVTVSVDTGETQITAITMATGTTVYRIEPVKNSASFTDELVVADNGAKYRTATVNFGISGAYSTTQKGNLDALSLGRYFVVLQLADGSYIGLGRLAALEASVATLQGGSEANGMTVTLTANLAESALPLSADAIDDLTD